MLVTEDQDAEYVLPAKVQHTRAQALVIIDRRRFASSEDRRRAEHLEDDSLALMPDGEKLEKLGFQLDLVAELLERGVDAARLGNAIDRQLRPGGLVNLAHGCGLRKDGVRFINTWLLAYLHPTDWRRLERRR